MGLRTAELADLADVGKLRDRFYGPLRVAAVGPAPNTYTLALPPTLRFDPVVNVDRLRPWVIRPRPAAPASDLRPWTILNHRVRRGRLEYFMAPVGLGPVAAQWRAATDFPSADPEVAEYTLLLPLRRRERRRRRSPSHVPVPGAGQPAPPRSPSPPMASVRPLSPRRASAPSRSTLGLSSELAASCSLWPTGWAPLPRSSVSLPLAVGLRVLWRWDGSGPGVVGTVRALPSARLVSRGVTAVVSFARLPAALSASRSVVRSLVLTFPDYGRSWVVLGQSPSVLS